MASPHIFCQTGWNFVGTICWYLVLVQKSGSSLCSNDKRLLCVSSRIIVKSNLQDSESPAYTGSALHWQLDPARPLRAGTMPSIDCLSVSLQQSMQITPSAS